MLLEPFLRQCRHQPEAVALVENGRCIRYGELLARSHSIAARLQGMGIKPGQPVAIYLDRGIDAVMALFGVLLAGACYVPLDLKNPLPRLASIITDAQVAAVLGLGAVPTWLARKSWLDVTDCPEAIPKPVETQADSLAAILYTSGSTGQARGVALSHGAIASFARWATDLVTLSSTDRIASSAPFFFDLSTFDLYAVLGCGASLHFVPSALALAPARLSVWLKGQEINGWYTVPSLLAFLAYKGNLAQTPLDHLRFLIFAGEVFPTPALMDLAAKLPRTALYNFFGPTETNVCCYWPVDRARLSPDRPIPIGLPAAGCELYIHDETGELWVRGPTLASGYWIDGGLQAFNGKSQVPLFEKRRVGGISTKGGSGVNAVELAPPPNGGRLGGGRSNGSEASDLTSTHTNLSPQGEASGFNSTALGTASPVNENWYPTGDRVSLVDGEYQFHGRLGRMLKCAGYRVEPSEIEASVNAMDGVRACAVVGIDDPTVGQRPALALALEPWVALADIRKALARQLPAYMQPSRCLVLQELPRLPNGKLDYNRVQALLVDTAFLS